MQVAWWGLIVIGAVLVTAGIYAVSVSQDQINYVKSCEKPVSCGTIGNPRAQPFLTPALTTSLQQAELSWIMGLAALGIGLASLVDGIYQYSQGRTGALVQAGVASPS